jgi:hypothetical protein
VKSKANSFSMVRGAKGFVPNFAEELTKFGASTNQSRYAAMVGEKIPANLETRFVGIEKNGELAVKQNKFENSKFVQFPVIGLPERSSSNINSLEDRIEEFGKSAAVNFASNLTGNAIPKEKVAALNDAKFNPGSLAAFAGTLFEASIGSMLGDKGFADYNAQSIDSAFDIKVNDQLKQTFPSLGGVDYVELKGRKNKQLMDSVAKKIYKVTEGQRAAQKQAVKKANTGAYIKNAYWFVKDGVTYAENDRSVGEDVSYSKVNPNSFVLDPKTVRNQKQISTANIRGASGYIPNFAQGGPLEDAIQREMAAGLDPSQIRVTTDGKLKSPSNPNGFAVINTRDEPNGKIPNFAKELFQNSKGTWVRSGTNQPASKSEISAYLSEEAAIKNRSATRITDRANLSPQQAVEAGLASSVPAKEEADKKVAMGLDKMLLAFSGITIATSVLESSFKDVNGKTNELVKSLSNITQSAASFALLGSTLGSASKSFSEKFSGRGGFLGKAAGVAGGAAKILPGASIALGVGEGIIQSVSEYMLSRIENAPAKAAGVESVKGITKEKDIRAELSKLGAKIIANPEDDKTNAAYDELKIKLAEINKEKKKEKEQEEKNVEAAKKRLALANVIGSINESFANKQNEIDTQRIDAYAKLVEGSANLTEQQKFEQDINQRSLEFQNKRADLKRNEIKQALNIIANSSATATIDKEALDALQKKLQTTGDLNSVEEELKKLQTEGAVNAATSLRNLRETTSEQYGSLTVEEKRAVVIARANNLLQNQTKSYEIISQKIQENVRFSIEFSNTIQDIDKKISNLQAKTPLIGAEREIASRGFATNEQRARLSELKRAERIRSETESITTGRDTTLRNLESSTKQSALGAVKGISYLGGQDVIDFQKRIQDAADATEALEILREAATMNMPAGATPEQIAVNESVLQNITNLTTRLNVEKGKTVDLARKELALIDETYTRTEQLDKLRGTSPFRAGLVSAIDKIEEESINFTETFSYNTTIGFRDGLRDALGAAVSGTDDLRGALQGVAQGFLKTMQQAFLQQASNNVMIGLSKALPSVFPTLKTAAKGGYVQKFASGGFVTGGSGIRDDVPAMLSSGEYVMRKSAVQKYGAENMAKMNSGGIFLPGVRGGSEISGYDQLSKFANQTTTSGATDVLKGGRSSAFANLEDQSVRLSRFGLMNEDTIKGEVTSAQEQGLDLIAKREAYRTQQRKAMQQQIVGTALALAVNMGVGALSKPSSAKIPEVGQKNLDGAGRVLTEKISTNFGKAGQGTDSYQDLRNMFSKSYNLKQPAYGGMIRGFNNGGGPTDDIPALLMGGEYVMDRATVRKYGKQYLDSMNSGRAKFAEGGYAGAEAETTTESTDSKAKVDANTGTAVNISINVSGGNSSTESQGQTSQGGVDYKKMSERIKAVVLETLNEEKRLGGSLRTR